MKSLIKNFIFILLIFLVLAGVFTVLSQTAQSPKEIPLTEVVQNINQGNVKKIVISGNDIAITFQDDSHAQSKKETEAAFSESLANYGVSQSALQNIEVALKEEGGWLSWLGPISIFVLPLIIFVVFFWMIFRQAKVGASQAFDFSRAKARLFGAEGHSAERITFKDVAGLAEAKEELKEIVEFLKFPKKFLNMGARIPRGVLLMGPPGTGKTLLARAVAGEAHVPFFHISGSEFVEMFVGVGAARTRDLFSTAKKAAPSIIFIDELDAVGRHRGAGLGGGHDEREQTLNQILTEMDGFERDTNVIVTAATNRPDVLDPALLRPGRFDRRVVLDLPDINDREAVLKIHAKGKPLALSVNLREIAERTPGFSGADLANLANEAAILAARKNKQQIAQEELLESIDKVLLGPERRSHILSKDEKLIAAYHEAGHALVASSLPHAEPVRKISIIARGRAAGYTLKLPTVEKHLKTKSDFMADLAMFLGGYCAEELVFGEITTGASNDLEKASELARSLVKEYGMSERLGPIAFGAKEELVFLGKDIGEQRNYSEKIAEKIDEEISRFIQTARVTARSILKRRRGILNKIAATLAEKETIEREEYEALIKGAKTTVAKTTINKPMANKFKKFKIKAIK
ncbi:MAG: ATP-dependent zinc metalloprotease FtsH [Candidatus Nealsonbacteria bacterium]